MTNNLKEFKVTDILHLLPEDTEVVGNSRATFSNVNTIKNVNSMTLDWINSNMKNKEEYLAKTSASVIICERHLVIPVPLLETKCFIKCKSPKLIFSKIVTGIFKEKVQSMIHPSATISKNAKIGKNVYIGANVILGDVEIDDNSIIYGNTVLNDGVKIGKNVQIGFNNVIGADGFGYERTENNELFKFPHLAGVTIEDDVEIGNCTCIDRGALSDTIIGKGTKIDNLVHIAHNVEIGQNCCVIANSMIAGSVKVGDNTWIAPNAAIREHLTVGKDSLIGLGAIVTKSVGDNDVIAGFPALPFTKMISIFKRLLKDVE